MDEEIRRLARLCIESEGRDAEAALALANAVSRGGGLPRPGGWVGIDAGVDGFAALVQGGRAVKFWPAPVYGDGARTYDVPGMLAQVREWASLGVGMVVLERLSNLPPRMGGGRTNFVRGLSMGCWRTALSASGVPFQEVDPQEWKRSLGIAGDPDTLKQRAVQKAQGLFPGVDFRDHERRPGARTPCPDKAEAALLAWYCERLQKGQVAEFEEAKRAWREDASREARKRANARRRRRS